MTKRRGPSVEQRGEIEMPPLDHQFPAEMGVPQAAQAVEAREVEQLQQEYQDHEQEVLVEQDEQYLINEVAQEEPEFSPTPVDQSRLDSNKRPKTKEDNFREVRLAKERAERERDALMSQMLEMQSKLQNQQQVAKPVAPVEEEKDWFDGLDPESLVEGKQLKNIAQEMKAMKRMLKEQQAQSQEIAMQAKIKAQYPDFDDVFNAQTISNLNEQYPDVANALRVMPDDYNKATAAYTMIKNLGIYKGNEVKKPAYESDILRAKVNAAKPRPLASVNPQQGDSPLSKANAFANGLTPDLKAQMLKEMQAARRGN
jgi:hypothetical protein